MKKLIFYSGFTFLLAGVLFSANHSISNNEYTIVNNTKIIADETIDAFNQMMQVISHERCVNCHPSDDVPKQGDESRPHYFDMARGTNDKGFEATKCATCHQEENNLYSGVPGAPHWALAPKTMAWQGLSKNEIAEAMLDKTKNGNRSHEDLVHHLTEDKLVLWAFNPGVNQDGVPRTKPPVSEEEYKAAVKEWFEKGAVIPDDE